MALYYWDSPHKQITKPFFAEVVKVVDGDTIRAKWTERNFDFPIRIARIDAPEMSEVDGPKSKNWLENQIMGHEVLVLPTKTRVEKWGRLLAEVIGNGMNVGELSLMLGYSQMFGDVTNKIPEVELWL